jgi:nicotinamidase/pyrazinamidase
MAQNALIVVDVQNDFCPGGALAVTEGDQIVAVLNRLIREFDRAGAPVIATRDWHPRRTSHFNTHGGAWPPHCVQGTAGAEFHPGLALGSNAVIVSKGTEENADSYSGFDGVDSRGVRLVDMLQRRGVTRLLIGGLATDYCVKQTALDGLRQGFEVVVLEDAVRGVDLKPGDSDRALEELRRAGAQVGASNGLRQILEPEASATQSEFFPYAEELETAERAATAAGAAIMGLFKGQYDVQEKSKNNPVTSADLEANRLIREIVRARFPADGWLSEEDKDGGERLAMSRVWVIDPIDGTKEFIEGVPQFAVSIAFVENGRPKAAIIFNPAQGEMYKAGAGLGAFLNGQPICVTARQAIDGARLLVSRSEPQRKFQVFVDRCELKPVGSIAYRLAKVAAGDGDGTLTFRSIYEWDICAGALMVEAAGGRVVDGSGNALVFNQREPRHRGVVAASPRLSRDLQGLWQATLEQQK